jgi:hypothetical protein
MLSKVLIFYKKYFIIYKVIFLPKTNNLLLFWLLNTGNNYQIKKIYPYALFSSIGK